MLSLRPEYHRNEYHHGRCPAGYNETGPTISVELDDDGGYVHLSLDPISDDRGRLPDGTEYVARDVDRFLTAPEARELAAVLVHYAGEIEADRC